AAGLTQGRQMAGVPQEMLDFDGHVVGQLWKSPVEGFDDAHGVARSVEKVRIAKRDVARPGADLLCDVLQHHLRLDDAEYTLVHRWNGAVAAQVLAAARGLRIAHRVLLSAR